MPNVSPLKEGQILTGSLFSEPMRVETVRAGGPETWIVGYYRGQFTAILRSSSYEHLAQMLREKIAQFNVKTKSSDTRISFP